MSRNTATVLLVVLIALFVAFAAFTYINVSNLQKSYTNSIETTTEIMTMENADL